MLIVRHAQSEWNLHFGRSRIDPGLPDPALTAFGIDQAEELARDLAGRGLVRIVASPYRRTLQTAAILARHLNVPVTIEPLVRERCAFSCDQGSSPSVLAAEWQGVDFSALDELWWGGFIESNDSLERRCARFRTNVAAMHDADRIAVVSHWGFIRGLTGREVANAAALELGPAELHPR